MNAAVTIGTLMRDAVQNSGQDWDLTSLKTIWLGGQAPSAAIMKWWQEQYGTYITQGWGMTENTPQICFSAIKSTLRDGASEDELIALRQKQGQPIPLVQIKVLDVDGDGARPGTARASATSGCAHRSPRAPTTTTTARPRAWSTAGSAPVTSARSTRTAT